MASTIRETLLHYSLLHSFRDRADPRESSGLPRARGPNSMRPWNQPRIFPFASISAAASAGSVTCVIAQFVCLQYPLNLLVGIFISQICVTHLADRQLPSIIHIGAERRAQASHRHRSRQAGRKFDPLSQRREFFRSLSNLSATPPAKQNFGIGSFRRRRVPG